MCFIGTDKKIPSIFIPLKCSEIAHIDIKYHAFEFQLTTNKMQMKRTKEPKIKSFTG